MKVFRLVREKYADTLSGFGAALKGARWNSAGIEMIYTASNRSLAMAEVAVHFTLATLPSDYLMITIGCPDDIQILEIKPDDLSEGWNDFPHGRHTQIMGDKFILENEYCLLKVPSVVTKGDFNFLINPRHPDFNKIKIEHAEPFPFDKRIFGNRS
jgi:RES domain-containing protein